MTVQSHVFLSLREYLPTLPFPPDDLLGLLVEQDRDLLHFFFFRFGAVILHLFWAGGGGIGWAGGNGLLLGGDARDDGMDDDYGIGDTDRLGAIRSLVWAVEASRARVRFLEKDDGFIGLGLGFAGGTGWMVVFSVVSALGSDLPAAVADVLDRYEFGFRWIIITCRARNTCVWLVVPGGEALASARGTGSVSRSSRRLRKGKAIVCGLRTGPQQ